MNNTVTERIKPEHQMSKAESSFGQSDAVRLSDKDAATALIGKMRAGLVDWARHARLQEGNELDSEIDFTIPHCLETIKECVALVRETRHVWLATETPAK